MFRKLWKTLKFFILIIIVLICLPHSILPKQTTEIKTDDIEYYNKLNNSESRLKEFKDSEQALKNKLIQLEVINFSRKKFNCEPLKLDILASRVANKVCREAAENNYIGHWNLAGEKPYHRYAFAGGHDHVSENAFGAWSSDNYDVSDSNIKKMMKSGHETFMSEKAPYDGHKKNIIEKSHNWVGIGYYLKGNQFRYYEEFIDRYFEFENIPEEVKVDEPFTITVKTGKGDYLYYMIIYREDFPEPMKAAKISKIGSYQDFTSDEYLEKAAWDLAGYRNGSEYKIPLSFPKEGLYYIQIYSDKKEITKPSSVNTKGKTAQSGIVIKVKKR